MRKNIYDFETVMNLHKEDREYGLNWACVRVIKNKGKYFWVEDSGHACGDPQCGETPYEILDEGDLNSLPETYEKLKQVVAHMEKDYPYLNNFWSEEEEEFDMDKLDILLKEWKFANE